MCTILMQVWCGKEVLNLGYLEKTFACISLNSQEAVCVPKLVCLGTEIDVHWICVKQTYFV